MQGSSESGSEEVYAGRLRGQRKQAVKRSKSMEAYRTNTVVHDDGTVVIDNLPFRKGQKLEVILLEEAYEGAASYALRGEPVKYDDPFGSVAEDEWENAD